MKLEQYLAKVSCKGCYNHCSLNSPMCGRSKIFVKEAIEKYNKENKTKNFN